MEKNTKNKGFSLVELVVVVAIMGVMMAVGGYALSAISLANAKQTAKEIEAALVRTRAQSYSSDSGLSVANVTFYKENDGIYMLKNYEGTAEKIGSSNVSVSYLLNEEIGFEELGKEEETDEGAEKGAERITFSFNRSSGAFRSLNVDGQDKGTCKAIRITSGSRTYTITCYEKTGKIKLE